MEQSARKKVVSSSTVKSFKVRLNIDSGQMKKFTITIKPIMHRKSK